MVYVDRWSFYTGGLLDTFHSVIFMYVCMQICMYILSVSMYECIHVSTYVCICMYACMHICMYVCMYLYRMFPKFSARLFFFDAQLNRISSYL